MILVSAFEPPAIVAGLDVKSRFNSVFSNVDRPKALRGAVGGAQTWDPLNKSLATS